ncbi:type I glyceraldehyde-3-phosphate dehydrogenase [Dactylosporangium sp. AC04546]|uniref:type I glyceraldehyde-3-phosphate dehydrogenase n=1 Tax=Dactylosporangium sp. AC04546 TaxID=2862460 RepID=UPI001EDCA982|nr:type I glyceraldehyde-3-phosphate dehydrogenase [Dactylosporangium sp. AC04546]WVK78520.1 type I glyceraldehyde-3-phosphate dehydrogenase [Dactylosporangium sp. AC04546]
MTYRIAVNGFGRIGRDFIRCLVERDDSAISVVAVNDLFDTPTLAHLLQHDSTFGRLRADVEVDPSGGGMTVGGRYIEVLRQRDPAFLPWADLGVDLVIESTGRFRSRDDAAVHLKAGARKVLISAPGKDVDATIVLGVNADTYDPDVHDVVSAASCTTNCAAPMAQVLHNAFGIEQGVLTTVHAYTNDQSVLDAPHKDLRRARTAATNIIPTSTGAAKAIGLVLPGLAGRLGGVALRVPVENGSLTDLTVRLSQPARAEQVNAAFAAAAAGPLAGILRYSEAPLVSRDIIGDPSSCVFDAGLTSADGRLVKVFGWYDNEWGYTNRLVDLATIFAAR